MQGAEYPIRWKKGVYPVLEDMRSAALAGDLFLAENGAPELLVPGMLISWIINSHSCAKSFAGIPETKKLILVPSLSLEFRKQKNRS